MKQRPIHPTAASSTPPTKRIAVYCRVSSDESMGQTFTSIDAQRAAGEAYIASRASEGWELVPDRFDDIGYTGANLNRPAVQRLFDRIRANGDHRVNGVVFRAIDRISRSVRDICAVNDILNTNDALMASITQGIDTSSVNGRFMMNVLVSFGECERDTAVERTRSKIAATRRQGIWRGGRPPLGFDHGPVGLIVNAGEASVVRLIFGLYLNLKSLAAVVTELGARKITNKAWTSNDGRALGGRGFSKSTLSALLSNPLHAGLVPHRDAIYPGKHQAIIDPDVFAHVQRVLAENNRSGTGIAGAQQRHAPGLLKGLLVCGCCNRAMQYSTSNGDKGVVYRYVKCVTPSCPTKAVSAGEIEGFVLSKVRGTFNDAGLITKVLDLTRARANERILDLQAQRDLLLDELRDAESLLTHADESIRTEAASRHAQATSTLASVERGLTEARGALVDRTTVERGLREFESVWACLSPSERSQLLACVVERVIYDAAKGEVRITMKDTTDPVRTTLGSASGSAA